LFFVPAVTSLFSIFVPVRRNARQAGHSLVLLYVYAAFMKLLQAEVNTGMPLATTAITAAKQVN
jgi:hypothetical protein